MIAKTIKKTVKLATKGNEAALKNSENLVKQFLHFGDQYNKRVLKKALQGGIKIAKRQHMLNLEALELTKKHLYKAKNRWNNLTDGSIDEITEDVQDFAKKSKEFAQKSKDLAQKTIEDISHKAEELGIKTQDSKNTQATANTESDTKVDSKKKLDADTKTDSDSKTDFTQIKGVGPKLAEVIEEAGIHTFEALATGSLEELKNKLESLGGRYKAIDLDELSKQASELI